MRHTILRTAATAVLLLAATACTSETRIPPFTEQWDILADDVTATVYNACPGQCNADFIHTASGYTLNLDDVLSDHVIAMERTMMTQYGVRYGDIVKIEGAGRWDGLWLVHDTMNIRFAGQHKIDILVPGNIRHGKWKDVKVYVPGNRATASYARSVLARA